MIPGVMNWNACGYECWADPLCLFWTWHDGTNTYQWANVCSLMVSYSRLTVNEKTISGPKFCFGEFK